jgi:hypothetical protein
LRELHECGFDAALLRRIIESAPPRQNSTVD